MTLDTITLRVAFGITALTLLLLFYFVTFRNTRSTYSAWWCAALALFLAGSMAYLLDGTFHQRWANPLGNSLLVMGGSSVWAGARSLRSAAPKIWQLAVAPVLTALASFLDDPATNDWSGGPVFLAFMFLTIALASRELWCLERAYSRVHRPLSIAAGLLAVFYLGRWIAFLVEGRDGAVFGTYFGSSITTLATMVLVVAVSFSMASLSNEQLTRELKERAAQDGLTGLLNRSGFTDLAAQQLHEMKRAGTSGSLILADLDHFKSVNDTYGHGAGDSALKAFADTCTSTVRSTDFVGRYGGEEFIMLLPGAEPAGAESIAIEIGKRLAATIAPGIPRLPTASYGIVEINPAVTDLEAAIASADAALYRAKSLGRNRVVRADVNEELSAGGQQQAECS